MHFSTRQYSLSTRQCLCPLIQLVQLDNACVNSYDSTTDCLGPCLPNEKHFSTRQYSLSTRQCLCPLERLVQLDNACVHSYNLYDSTTDCLGPCLPNEMHFLHSTIFFDDSTTLVSTHTTCTTRQRLCQLVRLDNWLLGPLTYIF